MKLTAPGFEASRAKNPGDSASPRTGEPKPRSCLPARRAARDPRGRHTERATETRRAACQASSAGRAVTVRLRRLGQAPAGPARKNAARIDQWGLNFADRPKTAVALPRRQSYIKAVVPRAAATLRRSSLRWRSGGSGLRPISRLRLWSLDRVVREAVVAVALAALFSNPRVASGERAVIYCWRRSRSYLYGAL
jgi:hypothetical protein